MKRNAFLAIAIGGLSAGLIDLAQALVLFGTRVPLGRFTYPLPLETRRVEAANWKFTIELKGSLFGEEVGHDWWPKISKTEGLIAESAACSSRSP